MIRSAYRATVQVKVADRNHRIIDAETVSQVAAKHFGAKVVSIERFSEGVMNYMFLLTTNAGERFVLRLYPTGRSKVARYEAQLIIEMHSRGCLVPEVLGFSFDDASDEIAHLVYRFIPGETLAMKRGQLSTRDMLRIAGVLIDNLKLMAGCEVSGFGGLVTARTADCETAWEFFHRSMSRGIEGARETGVLSEQTVRMMENALSVASSQVMQFDGKLAWGDLAPSNIVIDADHRLVGMVDFESTFALDRALSVGYLLAIAPDDPLIPLLRSEGMRQGFAFDERNLQCCAVLRAARMARFAHRDLPSGTLQQPIETLFPGALRALAGLTVSSLQQ